MAARPSWDSYYLGITRAVAARADCTRRQVGAVIVDVYNRIAACGYNGAPAGEPGCLSDGACPRGRHYRIDNPVREWAGACACGYHSWPCPDAVEPSSGYDTGPGVCRSIHAEANSLLYSSWEARQGATMYVTCEPCAGCARLIRGSGILRVVWPEGSDEWGPPL